MAEQYVPLPAWSRVLPCTQFAVHAKSSGADLLRVLHDFIWFRFHRRTRVHLVFVMRTGQLCMRFYVFSWPRQASLRK